MDSTLGIYLFIYCFKKWAMLNENQEFFCQHWLLYTQPAPDTVKAGYGDFLINFISTEGIPPSVIRELSDNFHNRPTRGSKINYLSRKDKQYYESPAFDCDDTLWQIYTAAL